MGPFVEACMPRPRRLCDCFGGLDRRSLIRQRDRHDGSQCVHHLAGTFGDRDQLLRETRVRAVTSHVHGERRESLRRPVQRSGYMHLHIGHHVVARTNRSEEVAREAAAQRDDLILATRRSEVEAALGSAAVDEHRVGAHRRARGRVVDVLNRRFESCGHPGSI
jgi:hypothetical protein